MLRGEASSGRMRVDDKVTHQFVRVISTAGLHAASAIFLFAVLLTWDGESHAQDPPSPKLTLSAAVDYALKHSPRLAAAQQGVTTEEADVAAAKAQRWPRLDMDAAYRYSSTPAETALAFPLTPLSEIFHGQAFSHQQLSFGQFVTQPIYLGGRIRAATRLAESKRELSRISVRDVGRMLTFDVAASYAHIFQIERDIAAAAESLDSLQRAQRDAFQKFQTGKIARVDLLKVDARLADVRDKLIELRDALQTEHGQLNALLGRPVLSPVVIDDTLPEPPISISLEAAIATALRDNPEYQAAEQQVRVAELTAALTRTQLNPSISAVGGYFINSPSPFRSEVDSPIVGVVASFPFFDHTVTERQQEDLSRAEEQRRQLHQIEFDIGQRVQAAYLAIQDARERIEATQAAIAAAREALRIEMLKYHLGREIVENLLDAQAALLTTEADYDQAVAGYTTAAAALQRETEIRFFAGGKTK